MSYKIRRKRSPLDGLAINDQVDNADLAVEFAKRLQRLMDGKGWSQSDPARQATLFLADNETGAKQVTRDNISRYMNGRSLPRGDRLLAIAKALGADPADLVSTEGLTAVANKTPPTGVHDIGGGKVWLRINQACDWPVALKILELLKGEKTE